MNKLTLREVQGEYHGNDNCMTEILAALPARDLTVEEAFELYKEAVKWSDGDEVIVKEEGVRDKDFNEGYWCAVQTLQSEGAGSSLVLSILRSAGFTREEFLLMVESADFKKDELMPLINQVLKEKDLEEIEHTYTEEKWLPEEWVPYFVNADATGLTDEEQRAADEGMKDMLEWYSAKTIRVVYEGGEPELYNLGYPTGSGLRSSLKVSLLISNK